MKKKQIVRIAFVVQLACYTIWYIWGDNGLQTLARMAKENEKMRAANTQLEQELDQLTNRIALLKYDSFYAEAIARQQLQMARSDETVYFID